MKANTHPTYFENAQVICVCGNHFTVGSTQETIHVELCNKCHPFYTGEQRFVDRGSLIQKFQQKQTLEEGIKASEEKQQDNFDERNIILEVKGAAGGDEAKIWAEELLRMYTRSAQKRGLRAELLEEGIIKISGYNAFGNFKYEA